jgi:hypothetical protein
VPEGIAGYQARFVYRIHQRSLRGSLYPPRTVLYRKDKALYRQHGHTQRVVVDGDIRPLQGAIYHDDRKPLTRWFASQQRYAQEEAKYLLTASPSGLRRTDRIRLLAWPAPIGVLFYTLFVRGCVFDGWSGWYYALQRTVSEILVAIEILDRRLGHREIAGTENHDREVERRWFPSR